VGFGVSGESVVVLAVIAALKIRLDAISIRHALTNRRPSWLAVRRRQRAEGARMLDAVESGCGMAVVINATTLSSEPAAETQADRLGTMPSWARRGVVSAPFAGGRRPTSGNNGIAALDPMWRFEDSMRRHAPPKTGPHVRRRGMVKFVEICTVKGFNLSNRTGQPPESLKPLAPDLKQY
jgi:hypothetical protein